MKERNEGVMEGKEGGKEAQGEKGWKEGKGRRKRKVKSFYGTGAFSKFFLGALLNPRWDQSSQCMYL